MAYFRLKELKCISDRGDESFGFVARWNFIDEEGKRHIDMLRSAFAALRNKVPGSRVVQIILSTDGKKKTLYLAKR